MQNAPKFENLEKFIVRELLGAFTGRKSIFVLLEHIEEKKPAVLIVDKSPFSEDLAEIAEWIKGSSLKQLSVNDAYLSLEMTLPQKCNAAKTTLIYPAGVKDIEKYRSHECHMLVETPQDYELITLPYIKSLDNLQWVYNLLEGKQEMERVVLDDTDEMIGFMLAPDLKWNGDSSDNLYLQAIIRRRDIKSIRDLTGAELPLLENIREKCREIVLAKYGVPPTKLKMFLHYQPTYYHLHVHIVHLKYDAPGMGLTNHSLDDVIETLKQIPDFYSKASFSFVRKVNDTLYNRFLEAGRVPTYAFPTPTEQKCNESPDEEKDMDAEPPAKKERKEYDCTDNGRAC